jgi:DNA-binding response OmpR family regulator
VPYVKKVLFLGKRADYYRTIVDALHERGLKVAIATRADSAVAICLTGEVLLVIIDCDEDWPSDCWHPARSIRAVAPLVPIIGLMNAESAIEFVDAYCMPTMESVQAQVMKMVAGK